MFNYEEYMGNKYIVTVAAPENFFRWLSGNSNYSKFNKKERINIDIKKKKTSQRLEIYKVLQFPI